MVSRKALLGGLLLYCFGCGGGRGDSGLAGSWGGQLYQAGGLPCSDGNFLGVGSGVETRKITFSIHGGEAIGDEVTLTLDGCTYRSRRERPNMIEFTSEEMHCSKSVTATEITDAAFNVFIDARAARQDDAGNPTCAADESGEMVRE